MKIELPSGEIRPWEPKDLPILLRALQQERIRKNLRSPLAFSTPRTGIPTHFAIIVQERTVGGIGFDFDPDHPRVHLGFWIDEAFENQGITSESIPLICNWFHTHHPERIVQASVYGWNPASRKILEKSSFSLVAHLPQAIRYADEITDLYIYEWDSLSLEMWKTRVHR